MARDKGHIKTTYGSVNSSHTNPKLVAAKMMKDLYKYNFMLPNLAVGSYNNIKKMDMGTFINSAIYSNNTLPAACVAKLDPEVAEYFTNFINNPKKALKAKVNTKTNENLYMSTFKNLAQSQIKF